MGIERLHRIIIIHIYLRLSAFICGQLFLILYSMQLHINLVLDVLNAKRDHTAWGLIQVGVVALQPALPSKDHVTFLDRLTPCLLVQCEGSDRLVPVL
jgi:hypothetical protein